MTDIMDVDCIVVGAGVVGLAIARSLAMSGREVIVLEREAMIGSITSARNSEVIHGGLYYPAGSAKARFCVEGKHRLYAYCRERDVAHRRCGKLVVAGSAAETGYLEKLLTQAHANGVDDCQLIDRSKLSEMAPAIRGHSALLSPSTGIIDSHGLMQAYASDIEMHGGAIVLHSPLLSGALEKDGIRLSVGGRDPVEIKARLMVNAAGLDAWGVSRRIEGLDPFAIPACHLAKGSYFSLAGKAPATQLIYPVPEAGGLGVHLTLDLAGQARFGPDVEWISDEVEAIDYAVDPERSARFYAAIRRYWPDLRDGDLIPAYSGVRPKTAGPEAGGGGDFVIQGPAETGHAGYVALYGIESPGLTSSLAIAEDVLRMVHSA